MTSVGAYAGERRRTIAFLGVFIVYQIYRMTFAPSVGLAGLTIFDVFIAWLTYLEYRRHTRKAAAPA